MEFYIPFFEYPPIKEFDDVLSWRVIDPDECIRTGDILLFSSSSFMSSTIKACTGSRWNHTGMACWCEILHVDGRKTVDLFSFEMGSQPFTDLMTGTPADKEVRLVRLADIADMYDIISVRRLNSRRNTPEEKSAWSERFLEFMWKWRKTPYYEPYILIKVHLFTAGAPEHQTTCSTIATRMLDHMGLFKLNFDPSQISPEDFSSYSRAFPSHVFETKEQIIYKDSARINARLFFIFVVLVIIIVIIIYLIYRRRKSKVQSASHTVQRSSHFVPT
jgi:hypothetical protein